ncbi:hypothetical protein ABPG74_001304 [Tetrahymena malaccensis]
MITVKGDILKIKTTYETSPNIALVKYWGKFDEEYILPLNSSTGITLSTEDLQTRTTITLTNKYKEIKFLLNGEPHPVSGRLKKILKFFEEKALAALGEELVPLQEGDNQETKRKTLKEFLNGDLSQLKLKIKSVNSFPTASGLASSASGLAALSVCLFDVYHMKEEYEFQRSVIARLGSGSASRSIYGGLVEWTGVPHQYLQKKFESKNNEIQLSEQEYEQLSKLCIAKQTHNESFFEDLDIFVVAYSFESKEVPSTSGMLQSTQTSELLKYRALNTAHVHIAGVKQAIEQKNYNELARLVRLDSNQFHAVCLDTTPPIFYLNDFSKNMINFIHQLDSALEYHVAYTFDAGPHAVLLVHKNHTNQVLRAIYEAFSITDMNSLSSRAQQTLKQAMESELPESIQKIIQTNKPKITTTPSYIIHTKVGKGPTKIC